MEVKKKEVPMLDMVGGLEVSWKPAEGGFCPPGDLAARAGETGLGSGGSHRVISRARLLFSIFIQWERPFAITCVLVLTRH